jgi:thiol:disulfide interchange protein
MNSPTTHTGCRSAAFALRRGTALLAFVLFAFASVVRAQDTPKLYDPAADARAQIRSALDEARASGRHVLLQVGGNWCRWCVKLDKMMSADSRIDSLLRADYVLRRINYSKEQKNLEVLATLGYPQRFGFPVLIVLDAAGTRLHTQDSGLLEAGDGHDPDKVYRFLYVWRPAALRADAYRE